MVHLFCSMRQVVVWGGSFSLNSLFTSHDYKQLNYVQNKTQLCVEYKDSQREECAYLYKCIWWASVLCQTRFCTPNHRLCYFSPPPFLMCIRAFCDGGKTTSLLTWRNVSCDLTIRCTKHKGPWLLKILFCFSIFFSLFQNCGLIVNF